jgi:glycosyltransferase involved in cell wall biosynthesis
VAAVSEAALSSYREFLPSRQRKPGILAVVHTGVDIPRDEDEGHPSTRRVDEDVRPVLGSVGLRSVKRPDLLLEIFARIRPQVPEARCLLIGSDNEGAIERLEKLSFRLGIAGKVELPGQQRDMDPWYRRMHVYAHASRSEALPKAALEAMSHGLPVVAFDVGGNREVVENGETGLLCAEGDHEAFGRNLTRLLRDRELARRMGAAGRARVQSDFSAAAMVQQMTLLFDRVAACRVGEPASISPRTA